MEVVKTIPIGQSPQALVYTANKVAHPENANNLTPLKGENTQVITLKEINMGNGKGVLVVRSIGLTDLVLQSFNQLQPDATYTLALTKSTNEPYAADYIINTFKADAKGNYMGHTTGVVKILGDESVKDFTYVVLLDAGMKTILLNGADK